MSSPMLGNVWRTLRETTKDTDYCTTSFKKKYEGKRQKEEMILTRRRVVNYFVNRSIKKLF